jgi:signal transduction histidine kinase
MVDDKKQWAVQAFKYVFAFVLIGTGLIIFMALMKIWFLHSIYAFFVAKVSSSLGVDMMWAKLLAASLTVVALLAIPAIVSFLFLGRNKREFLIACTVIFVLWFGSLFYVTQSTIYFDRASGNPAKYYIKTMNEFKTSSAPDYDPETGLKYQPITPEIAKEMEMWAATGKVENMPAIANGKYFSTLTGEPTVWYVIDSYDKVKLFPLPGYNPSTGDRLLPVTKAIIKRYERERAEAERQAEEERQAEKRAREALQEQLAREQRAIEEQRRREAVELQRRQAEFEEKRRQQEIANRPPTNRIKLLDNAPVKALRFFESGRNVPRNLSEIVYRTRFERASTRYIDWDLEVAAYFNLFKQKQSFEIRAVWYKPDGSILMEENTVFAYDPSGFGGHYISGSGWDDPGHFGPGTYKVDLYVLDEKVASGSFEVVN